MKNHSLQSHCLTLGTDIRLCFPANPETFGFGRTGEVMDSPIGILFPFNSIVNKALFMAKLSHRRCLL